jgi:ankyrin repeat protein
MQKKILKLIINHGAKTRIKDEFGRTAFTWVNEVNNLELFNLLISKG